MFITETEMSGLLRTAVQVTAKKLEIEDSEWKTGEELLEEIKDRDREIYNLLQAFLNAYIDWFRFHQNIEKLGKQGLDAEENAKLVGLVRQRNAARADLLKRLH